MGDLNGKTELDEDFVKDITDDHSPINTSISQCYIKDNPSIRKNLDAHLTDQQGKRILELCKNMNMRILNGRTTGDEIGNFTRFPKSSRETPSAIYYALCSSDTLKEVKNFFVLPFTGLSDHCCLSLNIKINSRPNPAEQIPTPSNSEEIFQHNTHKYTYDSTKKTLFKQNLLNDKNIRVN